MHLLLKPGKIQTTNSTNLVCVYKSSITNNSMLVSQTHPWKSPYIQLVVRSLSLSWSNGLQHDPPNTPHPAFLSICGQTIKIHTSLTDSNQMEEM
jgi:hypothetical protein